MSIGIDVAKFMMGGMFVCVLTLISQVCSPKRFAGVFSATPAVLTAGLTVTLATSTAVVASLQAQGTTAGAVGLVAYCLAAGPAMTRPIPIGEGADYPDHSVLFATASEQFGYFTAVQARAARFSRDLLTHHTRKR